MSETGEHAETRRVFVRVREGETAHTGKLGEGSGLVITHRDSQGRIIAVDIPFALDIQISRTGGDVPGTAIDAAQPGEAVRVRLR